MPRWRLTDLDLDFVSLVASGDDPMAQVVLSKEDPMSKGEHSSRSHPGLERKKGDNDNWVEAAGGLPKYIERIARHIAADSGYSVSHAIASAVNQVKRLAAKGNAEAIKALAEWERKKASVKKDNDKSSDGGSSSSTLPATHSPEGNMAKINKSDLAPEVVEYIDSLEAEVDALAADVEKAESEVAAKDAVIADLQGTLSKSAPKDAEAEAEILKANLEKMDPTIRSIVEKQMADAAEAREIAKAEREQRLNREFISKAEALPMLSEDKADLASLLRQVADALPKESVEKFETILKAANEQIAKGSLFTTFGKSGAETTVSKSLNGKAEEIRKANPALSEDQALALAYEQNPDLALAAMNQEG